MPVTKSCNNYCFARTGWIISFFRRDVDTTEFNRNIENEFRCHGKSGPPSINNYKFVRVVKHFLGSEFW